MSITTPRPAARPGDLRQLCAGTIHLPGDAGYDAARMPWNVAVDQRPAAVAHPADTAEVAEVVRAAAAAGLRIAPQGTGHNAAPLGDLSDTLLLRTAAMTGGRVDAAAGRATVRAGTLWEEAVAAATAAGTGVLHGSSPDVGVVGYSLGGGMGWYARQWGLQTNRITGAEVVLADGSVVRADADHEPDLFWALRGGGGNFGVVTELEFATVPITDAVAGALIWDRTRLEEVLPVWAEWAVDAPDAVTTSFRVLQLPPLPMLPEFLRGRSIVMIDGAVLADDAEAARILAPFRALRPEIDTFARVPASSLIRLHMDPEGPTPAVSATSMLGGLSAPAVESIVEAVGPGSESSLLAAELRQLGGALGRPAPDAGALPCLDGAFVCYAVAVAMDAESAARGVADAEGLMARLSPVANGRQYLNFEERQVDASVGYRPDDWARLRSVRDRYDPDGVFHANHGVPRSS